MAREWTIDLDANTASLGEFEVSFNPVHKGDPPSPSSTGDLRDAPEGIALDVLVAEACEAMAKAMRK